MFEKGDIFNFLLKIYLNHECYKHYSAVHLFFGLISVIFSNNEAGKSLRLSSRNKKS